MAELQSAQKVADALEETARLMEFLGENSFKIRAYERGADAVRGLGEDLFTKTREGQLTSVSGIGKGLAATIAELVATGTSTTLEEVRARVPPPVLTLGSVPGVGPKKAQQLHSELGISTLGELEYAAKENRLTHLKGFGAKTQDKILKALQQSRIYAGRCRLDVADVAAGALLGALGTLPEVIHKSATGDVRRRCETVGHLEILAASPDPGSTVQKLLQQGVLQAPQQVAPDVVQFMATQDAQGTLYVVTPPDFSAALVFRTGTAQHLARLPQSDLALTSHGARRAGAPVHFETEADVYRALGLPFIPPELREDGTEVELARRGQLPTLIELSDLKGALHNHTLHSDGKDTAQAMQEAANALGLQYLGISDHSKSAFYARGLDDAALLLQRRELEEASGHGGTRLLHGVESDILEDGSLDYPPAVLDKLDFVVASIHSRFQHDDTQMTQRLMAAARNPYTDVIGHPTGRLLLSREPYAFDMEAVLGAVREMGCAMELNAHPQRLDLSVEHLRMCKRMGVPVCINADAHSTDGLSDLMYGIAMARRAGLTREDVLNTRTLEEMKAWLQQRRSRALARA